MVDQGPLPLTGGSTSHAPGLVFQTNASKTMTAFASYTVEKFVAWISTAQWCFNQVGGLEVATTPSGSPNCIAGRGGRHRGASRQGHGPAGMRRSCIRSGPRPDPGRAVCTTDGLAKAAARRRRPRPPRRRAAARVPGSTKVIGIEHSGGKVTGVATAAGVDSRRHRGVVRRILGPRPRRVDRHGRPAAAAGAPVRQDRPDSPNSSGATPRCRRRACRSCATRTRTCTSANTSTGSASAPTPTGQCRWTCATCPSGEITADAMPSMLTFTDEDFAPAWEQCKQLLPCLETAKVDTGFNGIFSFTPDGGPVDRRIPRCRRLLDRRGRLGDPLGRCRPRGRAVADRRSLARSICTAATCTASRRSSSTPGYVSETSQQNFVEIYDILHPLQPRTSPRNLRVSPFHARQKELGAVFLESRGWERPHWYEANAALVEQLPAAVAAARARRMGCEVPLAHRRGRGLAHPHRGRDVRHDAAQAARDLRPRCAVPAGASDHREDGQVDRFGHLHTSLDDAGGVRSDLTVARLCETPSRSAPTATSTWTTSVGRHRRRQRAGPRHHRRHVLHRPVGSASARRGSGTQPRRFLERSFKYFRAKTGPDRGVPVTAMRLSYVGELGWELYTSADNGLRLWDVLWAEGQSTTSSPPDAPRSTACAWRRATARGART